MGMLSIGKCPGAGGRLLTFGPHMKALPPLDIRSNTNHAPHVVILGAGASLAAFPNGDPNGLRLPLMGNLVETVGLEPILRAHGVTTGFDDFESLYDGLASTHADPSLLMNLESQVRDYFQKMVLPDEVTIYDRLLLSLRDKDMIASFNWDPFLPLAFKRNRKLRRLPKLAFLHGNVEVGSCLEHRRSGFLDQRCSVCAKPFASSKLLFPVKQKNYSEDPFIHSEWEHLRWHLSRAYFVTVFGYSAPVTDIEAKTLMLDEWQRNPMRDLAEIEIVDIRERADLESTWKEFFVRRHYAIWDHVSKTCCFRNVRRSCEAFAMATLQNDPWHENPFPDTTDLGQLSKWLEPLLFEEEQGKFSGKPCPSVSCKAA